MLELASVRSGWGGVAAVDGVSLRVPEGACVCLIGANGAGKTTHAAHDMRAGETFAGRILIGGEDFAGRPSILSCALAYRWFRRVAG